MSEGEVPASAAQTLISEPTDLMPTSPDIPLDQTKVNTRHIPGQGPHAAGTFTPEVSFTPPGAGTETSTDFGQVQIINRQELAEQAKAAGVIVPPGLENPAQKTAEPKTLRQKIGDGFSNLLRRGSSKPNTN